MKKIILIFSIFSLVLVGCKSCKDKTYPTYPIKNQTLIDGTDFKEGSYFIYQDSLTGKEDSFYVAEYSRYNTLQDNDGYYETINYRMARADNGQIFILAGGSKAETIHCDWALTDRLYNIIFAYFPFVEGSHIDGGSRSYDLLKFYPTLQVAGITHTNVYEMRSNTTNGQLTSLYSIQDGLIRFHISTPNSEQTWSLIRSNIIR